MNTIILIEKNRTQLVLQPETDHDKDVLKILEKLPNTHRAEFYGCQGGWTRHASGSTDLMIVFDAVQTVFDAVQTPDNQT
jgi:hypothetical protein